MIQLNLNDPTTLTQDTCVRHSFYTLYNCHKRRAHRIRLILEALGNVFVSHETHLIGLTVVALVWLVLDTTMLIAGDID